jgi:hypothetical protein
MGSLIPVFLSSTLQLKTIICGMFFVASTLLPVIVNGGLDYFDSSADKSKSFDTPTQANGTSLVSTWAHQMPTVGGQQRLICNTHVSNNGVPVSGVQVRGDGLVFNAQGQSLGNLPARTKTTNAAGYATFDYPLTAFRNSDTFITYRALFLSDTLITDAKMNCFAMDRKPCVESQTTACVNGGFSALNRFRIEAVTGSGQNLPVISSTGNQARFLSGSNTPDYVIDVINSCNQNNRFWVFAGGLTDVRTIITVTDTLRAETKTYRPSGNQNFQPIQDTSAFATCP